MPTQNQLRVSIRQMVEADFKVLFEYQLDESSNEMAGTYARSWLNFERHWTAAISDPSINSKVILADDALVGLVGCFLAGDQLQVGYWITKTHWGRGIASIALSQLLKEVDRRPIYAEVACKNVASYRVLEKNGFVNVGRSHSSETERYRECDTFVMRLDAPATNCDP